VAAQAARYIAHNSAQSGMGLAAHWPADLEPPR
jgi:hypothetical protein